MSEESSQTGIRAGCAQECITPPTGVGLAGYFHQRTGKTVRDDLYARAVVIEADGRCLALVGCDLIAMDTAIAARAKELIAAHTRIAPHDVLISATHTHTGPELRAGRVVPRAEAWAEALPERIAAAVLRAHDRLFAGTVRAGSIDVTGYSFNRLFRLRDGSEVFGRRVRGTVGVAGPIDPALQTLSLVDEEGRLRALVVNFALHVDVIGGGTADFISADWPGEMAANIAAVYGEDVVTVFLQGSAGDINHNTHDPTRLPRRGPDKAVQLGRALAGAAMCAAERAEPMENVGLGGQLRELRIPYYTRDAAFMERLAQLRAKPERTPFEDYTLRRGESWPHDGQEAVVPVQALRLGDVGLAAFPAEIFARIGLEVKHFSPSPRTLVVELANATASTYVPTPDQASRGAYGALPILSRWLHADAGRQLADAAQVMLWELW